MFQGKIMRKLILAGIFFSTLAFAGSPFKNFSGLYHVSSAPIHDPREALPKNTHLYLSLKGQPAQETYNLMEGEPKFTQCGVDHYYKNSHNFQCSYYSSKEEYSCDFSVNIKEGTINSGGWC
jgi:hypothetical protein